ncbi:MAG: hypothetical protein U9R17_04960 [Thermodesulfobacteriota bacterium]|nr:hypothetical protein [Thermodesulfobacteriota bacterium]
MDSKRTKSFKKLFNALPEHIKENSRKQYKLFLENQSHPLLRTKQVGSTRNNKFKVYEVTVGMGHRATYFRDGNVYVWFWIGTHN